MLYLTGSWQGATEPYLDAGLLGVLNTPTTGKRIRRGWIWAADNGAFNADTYVGDEAWFSWLSRQNPEGCLFATAPDVMGNHEATVARSAPYLARIREAGFPNAFVFQDGATTDTIPWGSFDWAFVGGTDAFKLGGADALILEARERGKRVHVGRVNSGKRFERFALLGADSADGTFLAFGPSVNLPHVLSWIVKDRTQGVLWK
jgi:hypothetical protein